MGDNASEANQAEITWSTQGDCGVSAWMTAAWLQQWQMSRRCARSRTRDSSTLTTEWNGTGHTAWMAAIPLNLSNHPTHVLLNLGCARSIGSRAAIRRFQKHALHYGITKEFCPCNKSFVFADSAMETCKESCIFTFQRNLHAQPELTCWRRVMFLSCSHFTK